MGCGRVGATLAVNLSMYGHSVAVIDHDSRAFRRLPDGFTGQRVTGVGFDRDALVQAGIEDAQGFAAVSSGDNSNIIAARVVRETFGVTNVVTRIYDPTRAEVYERLGIATVPTVRWAADQVFRRLIALGPHYEYIDDSSGMSLVAVDLDPAWFGHDVAGLESATGARVAYVTRLGRGLLPSPSLVLQDGDEVRLIVATEYAPAAQRIANHPAKEEIQ
ncbi:MAG: TrkA family potassium uptake protein [Actinomycetaceae bacterium]|nr:TrkA family potassium uptake protein [Actinomycetaceae bacterium]